MNIRAYTKHALIWAKKNYLQIAAVLLVGLWVIPYFSTGNKIEFGDFSFFAQGYEAIRVSILNFHQFPWWNPWMSGGIPLYANPQMGVFSIQTIFVLIFGTVVGLKIAMVLYIFAGYFSMYLLLRKFFKLKPLLAVPLSLAWIFCSFFVAHLPTHYTFLWFMLTPLYVYLALTIRSIKGALLLGGALALMALSAVHYPLFYIFAIVILIFIARIIFDRKDTRRHHLLIGAISFVTFAVLAGYRLFYAYANAVSFNREVASDPAISPFTGIKALAWPLNRTSLVDGTFPYPVAPFGWGETTASLGVIFFALTLVAVGYFFFKSKSVNKKLKMTIAIILASGAVLFIIGLGNYGILSPYGIMKHLPVLKNLRVSTRWFIFVDLVMILIVGLVIQKIAKGKLRLVLTIAIYAGVAELFLSNFWYQNAIFTHTPNVASVAITSEPFDQTAVFEKTLKFPDGKTITNDGLGATYYREYEATTYNIGVIRANEALVNNMFDGTVRCVDTTGCGFFLSDNATLKSWSPDKIVLSRKASGPIILNIDTSSYVRVNGQKTDVKKTADVHANLTITDPSQTITITYNP